MDSESSSTWDVDCNGTPLKNVDSNDLNEKLTSTIASVEGGSISVYAFQLIIKLLEQHVKSDTFNLNFFTTYMNVLKLADKDRQIKALGILLDAFKKNYLLVKYAVVSDFLTSVLHSLVSFKDYEVLGTICVNLCFSDQLIVLDNMFMLIEYLASEHISVRQVKIIFDLFQVEDVNFTIYYWQKIFPLMQNLWHYCADNPDAYFHFDGPNCGILDLNWTLVPKESYSIFAWFKISSIKEDAAVLKNVDGDGAVALQTPYLFSFLTESGKGIEVYIQSDSIVVVFNGKSKDTYKRQLEKTKFSFSENAWYFIAITHVYRVIVPDEFSLYINTDLILKKNIKFTKTKLQFTKSSLGNCATSLNATCAFNGSITGFAVLDGHLTPEIVRELYKSGLNLFKSSYKICKNFEYLKKSKFLVFCTPFATKDEYCYDPSFEADKRTFRILSDVSVRNTVKFSVSLFNLGGIQLLLPLFSPSYRQSIYKEIDVNSKLIAFITELIQGNTYYQNQMQRMRFFEIMGYLFSNDFEYHVGKLNVKLSDLLTVRKSLVSTWSTQSIILLNNMAVSIMPLGATNSTKTNGNLYRQFFKNIYMNFKIWSNTDFNVQKKVLEVIMEHIVIDPEFFHSFILIGELMVILREYYSYPAENNVAAYESQDKNLGFSILANCENVNLGKEELLTLRKIILNIVKVFLRSTQLKLSEVHSIFCYLNYELLRQEPEKRLICDLLEMLLKIIAETRFPFLTYINQLGSIVQLLLFLDLKDEKSRILVLKIISKYFQVLTNNAILSKEVKGNAQNSSSMSSTAQTVKFSIIKKLGVLCGILEKYPLNMRTYTVLVEILLEHSYRGSKFNAEECVDKEVISFKNIFIISTIFYLIKKSNDIEIKLIFVEDMKYYLEQNFQNRLVFLKEEYWQVCVLSLVECEEDGDCGDVYRKLLDAVVKIFALMLETCFVYPSCAKSMFQTTGAVIGKMNGMRGLRIMQFVSDLHACMLNFIEDNKVFEKCKSSALTYQIFLYYLDFLVGVMFIDSHRESCNLYFNGKRLFPFSFKYENEEFWMLFGLIQRVLETIDRLKSVRVAKVSEHLVSNISDDMLGDAEEFLIRTKMRLLLQSISQVLSLKSSPNMLRKRREAMNSMRFLIDSTVKRSSSEHTALLDNYFKVKKNQWKSEYLDSDIIFHENIKHLEVLLTHHLITKKLFLYGMIFLYVVMKILKNKKENEHVLLSLLLLNRKKDLNRELSQDVQVESDFNALAEVSENTLCLTAGVWQEVVRRARDMLLLEEDATEDDCALFEHGLANMSTFKYARIFNASFAEVTAFELQSLDYYYQLSDCVKEQIDKFLNKNNNDEKCGQHVELVLAEYAEVSKKRVYEFQLNLKNYRIKTLEYSSNVASLWRDFVRVLIEARVPCGDLKENDYCWALDSSENSQRMRFKLKKSYKNLQVDAANTATAAITFECSSDELEQAVEILSPSVSNVNSSPSSTNSGVFTTTCVYVRGIETISGEFQITPTNIHFRNVALGIFKSVTLSKVRDICPRRYMLKNTALEVFLVGGNSHFYSFDSVSVSDVAKRIIAQKPLNLREHPSKTFAQFSSHVTGAWRSRKISNFEYLIRLNDVAGRSYKDITQYPIFPWVICDYVSTEIDLSNDSIYRDLSKPIGALNEKRLSKTLERWELMLNDESSTTPPFMYGSHYSTSSIVLYFLIRLEPFTTQAINLQGGKFDNPARIFRSISETWSNVLNNSSDVKELIPEFFYLPEFLININNVNIGKSDVELPPWAPNAYAFIQTNHLALESEYVSAHLHEWIDLIFGYRQVGQEAIDACNVFHYLSYEGNVEINQIEDPVVRESVRMQIREFGQTPSQIFTKPHPPRLSLEASIKSRHIDDPSYCINADANRQSNLLRSNLTDPLSSQQLFEGKIISIFASDNNVLVVFANGLVIPIKCTIYIKEDGECAPDIDIQPCTFDGNAQDFNSAFAYDKLKNFSLTLSTHVLRHSLAMSPNGKTLYYSSTWDSSICVASVSSGFPLQDVIYKHENSITTLAISQEGSMLATGSQDCSIYTFHVEQVDNKKSLPSNRYVNLKLAHILLGHEDKINALALDSDLNILVSASQDGTCNIYELSKGKFSRVIYHEFPATLVATTRYGVIVSYCLANETIFLHSINGALINKISDIGPVSLLKITKNGLFVILAIKSSIIVRSLFQHSLKVLNIWKLSSYISAMETFKNDEFLLVGTSDGQVVPLILNYSNTLLKLAKIY